MRTMLKSKIHRATVTGADVNYEGSVTLDPVLMNAADILPYEQVQILDINNGARLTTYAIEGDRDSGHVVVNGAAARLIHEGDTVIILTYRDLLEADAQSHKPTLVYVDESNRITRTSTALEPPVTPMTVILSAETPANGIRVSAKESGGAGV